ncbi:hypothetical protein D3C86_1917300 [compost metagenome]
MAYYWSARGFGFEIVYRKAWDDVDEDNQNIKFGLLLPLNRGEKNQVIIEPLFKFNRLDHVDQLWKNHFSFGFNASIAIPKDLFK